MKIIQFKTLLSILFSFIFLLIITSAIMAKPQVIDVIQDDLTKRQQRQLCKIFIDDCVNSNVWAWKKVKENQYYLFSQENLYLLKDTNGHLNIINHWNFLEYEPKYLKPNWFGIGKATGNFIIHTLYPLDEDNMAVAVSNGWRENRQMEGLIAEDKVDFVKLKQDGGYQVLLRNVPYYYFNMSWKCLHDELKLNPQLVCSETEEFNTDVVYLEPGKWQIKMKYEREISSFSKKKALSLQRSFNVDLAKPIEINVPKVWLKD